jgi:Holliday junction resolvase RusA-like endonuclease
MRTGLLQFLQMKPRGLKNLSDLGSTIVVTINAVPLTANKQLRMHWAHRMRDRRRWRQWLLQALGRLDTPPDSRVGIDLVVYRSKLQDMDNAYASVKNLLDALVDLGWSKDDSLENLWLTVTEEKCKRGNERTTITWNREHEKDN